MTAQDFRKLVKDTNARFVDLKFIDLPGTWQHFSVAVEAFGDEVFEEGIGFDGSSIRGFQHIEESDMLLIPDAASAFLDPFCDEPTISMICNVKDPVSQKMYTRDPRHVAQKAERYLKESGIADTAYFGPELEFYIFDDVRYDQTPNQGFYAVDSVEGQWNSGKEESPNLGHKPRYKEGYFPVPPSDSYQNLRSKMISTMREIGVNAEIHHHEVGTAGQAEIDMKYNTLVEMSDWILKYKYVTKNVAAAAGKTVTFMPKPLFQDNGSGMHVHTSLWKEGKNLFFDKKGYALMSGTGTSFHWWRFEARTRATWPVRTDDEFLPAVGSGVRGTRQPGSLPEKPQRGGSHPDVFRGRKPEAGRVSVSGSVLQSVSGPDRHSHGRAGRGDGEN